jgi:RNA polymerase sigma factor (sigma-70 family)
MTTQTHRLASAPAAGSPGPARNRPATDRELLRRFAEHRDERAFAALVCRHGPMVLATCRRVLHDGAGADDAFQATFLALARGGKSPGWDESVAGWLHLVATRLARRARRAQGRRARRESEMRSPAVIAAGRPRAPRDPLADVSAREICAVMDEELARLPAKERAVLVLCYLQGLTRDEAAAQLGWSLSTLKRTLDRGRAGLRRRMAGRGFGPAEAAATSLAPALAPASVLPAAAAAVAKAASAFAATGAVPVGLLAPHALALAKGAMKTMAMLKLKMTALFVTAAVTLGGAGAAAYQAVAQDNASAAGAAPANAAPDNGAFKKPLPGGGSVELVALSLPDSEFRRLRKQNPAARGVAARDVPPHWWAPDGRHLPSPDFRRTRFTAGSRHYEFVVRVEGVKDYDITATAGLTGAGAKAIAVADARGQVLPHTHDLHVPGLLDWLREAPVARARTSLVVSLATGPWLEVEAWTYDWEKMSERVELFNQSPVWFQWPRQRGADVEVDLIHTYTTQPVRLLAVDKTGGAHVSKPGIEGGGKGLSRCVYRFERLTLGNLKTIKLQARTYDREVEFRDVELMPDHVREVMDLKPAKDLVG